MSGDRRMWSRALVTGASAGIGRALALDLAVRGTDLVLVARDTPRLRAVADEITRTHGREVEVLAADLASPVGRADVVQRVVTGPFVDLLVNNAGIGTYGDFADTDIDAELATIDVNLVAPVQFTRAALGRMSHERRGSVLTVSSMDGQQPTPHHVIYGASKAFVNSFTEGLHHELRGSAITVTTVLPGYVRTEFTRRAGIDGGLDHVPSWLVLSPERVAKDALDGAAAGRAFVVPGLHYKLASSALSVLPSGIGRRIFERLAPRHTGASA